MPAAPLLLAALLAPPAAAGPDDEPPNLLPNHDLVAGDAGFVPWYVDRNGTPLGAKEAVFRPDLETGVLTVDFRPVRPLKSGGVISIEVPREDLVPGTKYRFACEARVAPDGAGETNFMVVYPGHAIGARFSPDRDDVGFTGAINQEWAPLEKFFVFDPNHPKARGEGETVPLVLLMPEVTEPVQMRAFSLTAEAWPEQ